MDARFVTFEHSGHAPHVEERRRFMSRSTPFDLTFAELATARFPVIRDEAATSQADLSDRARFARLPSVQRILADLADPGTVDERPDAADEYLTSLFVAYRFWEAGQHVIAVERRDLEPPLDPTRVPALPRIPRGACYLQLPEHWIWAQIDPAAPHEPVDGVFVTRSEAPGEVTVLAVLGLRPERGGYSQLAVRVTPAQFEVVPREVRSPPFEPVVAGGREAGLKSLVSVAELLLLVQLALARAGE